MRLAVAVMALALAAAGVRAGSADDHTPGPQPVAKEAAANAADDAADVRATDEGLEPVSDTVAPASPPRWRAEKVLPAGGMLIAYYGTANSGGLGVLGETSPEKAHVRLARAAAPFQRPGRPVRLVYELIVTVADAYPGKDGDFSHDISHAAVRRYVEATRRNGSLLVLDIQPGRANFLTVAKRWGWALAEPHVGLALDPEWRMGPRQVPGRVIGTVRAAEVNVVSAWLAKAVVDRNLPEKVFVLHQFRSSMLPDIGRHDRKPARRGFEQNAPEWLLPCGMDEHVGSRHEVWHVAPRTKKVNSTRHRCWTSRSTVCWRKQGVGLRSSPKGRDCGGRSAARTRDSARSTRSGAPALLPDRASPPPSPTPVAARRCRPGSARSPAPAPGANLRHCGRCRAAGGNVPGRRTG